MNYQTWDILDQVMDLLQHRPKYRYVLSKQYYRKYHPVVHHHMVEERLSGSVVVRPLVEGRSFRGRGRPTGGGGGVIWWWMGHCLVIERDFLWCMRGRLVVEWVIWWWRIGRLVISKYTLTLIQHIFHRLHSGLQILQLAFILALRCITTSYWSCLSWIDLRPPCGFEKNSLIPTSWPLALTQP